MKLLKINLLMVLTIFLVKVTIAQEGYFTTYGHEVEKGEIELMFMFDHTSPSVVDRDEGQKNFISQMPKIGYNPTDQLEIEFMVESFQEFGTGIAKFTGFRFETRYRLFKKEIFLNPTIYFEFEDLDVETRFKMETSGWMLPPYKENGEEPAREKILESRLILSQNIKNWNIALNWINETDTRNGFTPFGYAFGVMKKLHAHHEEQEENIFICPMHPDVKSAQEGKCSECGMSLANKRTKNDLLSAGSFAFEFLGAIGDSKQLGFDMARQEHYFQPSIMLHLPKNNMLSVGFAIGLSDASDDLVRIMLMKMF